MMTDKAERQGDATDKPKLRPANENPWYVLATLHGEQHEQSARWHYDSNLHAKNRRDWNKWSVAALDDKERQELRGRKSEDGRRIYSEDELIPHTPKEKSELRTAWIREYARRNENSNINGIPTSEQAIYFNDTIFAVAVYFDGFIFSSPINDNNSVFERTAWFQNTTFIHKLDCNNTIFIYDVNFDGTQFVDGSDFCGSTFTRDARFNLTLHSNHVDFTNAKFLEQAYFEGSKFDLYAVFSGVTFFNYCSFRECRFSNYSSFREVNFRDVSDFKFVNFTAEANFEKVVVSGSIAFDGAIFDLDVDFLDAKLLSSGSFARVQFNRTPPRFHGATLHEGTEWHGASWPLAPADTEQAQRHVYNYERLKQEMERLKKHEDELKFFALEMRAKRVVDGKWSPAGLLNRAYDGFSAYGLSISRPLRLFGFIALIAILFENLPTTRGAALTTVEAWGQSLANTFAILPFVKDAVKIDDLSATMKALGAVQGGIGALMLFLIGLALRNRFRLR
jgi:uncharacterized protein YjbI with pentapeptide repeats